MSETMRYIGSKNGKTQYQKELQDYKSKELNDICESFFQVIDYKIKQDRKKMEKNIGRPLATQDSSGNEGRGGLFPLELRIQRRNRTTPVRFNRCFLSR